MKRNILLAFLVATTTAGLAGAPAQAIDVECRYAIQPGSGEDLIPLPPPPPPGPQPNQVVYVGGVTRALSYKATYDAQQPLWSVVGVRSAPGTDYNATVRDCGSGRRALSILSNVLVDFIAVDGNQPMPGRMSVTVSNATDSVGTFALEYSTGGPALAPGTSQSLTMRGTPALVRDVYVPSGSTVTIILRLISGDADLAVVESTADNWLSTRAQAIATSTRPGLTEERVTITVPATAPPKTFGLVVVNNAALTEAVLVRV